MTFFSFNVIEEIKREEDKFVMSLLTSAIPERELFSILPSAQSFLEKEINTISIPEIKNKFLSDYLSIGLNGILQKYITPGPWIIVRHESVRDCGLFYLAQSYADYFHWIMKISKTGITFINSKNNDSFIAYE